jgi:hypothetical protein
MEEEETSRRDFLISVGAVAAIVAGLTGAGFLIKAAFKDRTTTELSDKVRTAEGTATKLPDEYKVAVQYEHETATLNDKDLFGKVEKDSKEVIVEFKEVYTVKRTYRGEFLERKLTGYRIVGVSPK